MAEPPTKSHALARQAAIVAGGMNAQPGQDPTAVVDLGWHTDPEHMTQPFIPGISNEDLWLLVRRFNKTVFHLRETQKTSVGGLDLGVAADEEFSPNKMRSQIERLYMGAIIGTLAFIKHVSRLRSWRERRRTAAFCIVYFAMWALDFLTLFILVLLIALIVSPAVRALLFPPAPIALVGSLSGGVTRPNAGILATTDSVTGAPENNTGEAVENEASNFVTALGAIAMNVLLGTDPQGEPNSAKEGLNGPIPSPDKLATMVATMKDKAEGVDKPSHDKTKVPMETIMWSKMRLLMHAITMFSDTWEKSGNLLNPKPPFPPNYHRLRLASLIVPLAAASVFLTRDLFVRSSTFTIGLGFFGDPVLKSAYHLLNYKFPVWTESRLIDNTIFRGVPTNSQLALTLLRLGEARHAPLPPPPRINKEPSMKPVELSDGVLDTTGDDYPLGATDAELTMAAGYDKATVDHAGGEDAEVTEHNSKKSSKVLNLIRGGTKAAVRAGVAFDRARAKAGHGGAKNRVGIIPSQNKTQFNGPVEFDARYEGQKGYLRLDAFANPPMLVFNKVSAMARQDSIEDHIDFQTFWSLPINDITELRKHSGYGMKAKLLAGWALNEELNDSLGLSDRHGNEWAMTAIPHRDELFNRLIAVGEQKWETR